MAARNKLTTIGQRLRAARKAAGMTQTDLSYAARIPQARITGIETDKARPSVKTAQALAGALGITLDELLGSGAEKRA